MVASCATRPPAAPEGELSWREHRAAVAALDAWTLDGRLNVREGQRSDTVNLNWREGEEGFEISMSGTLGLGAVRIGSEGNSIVVEKAGEEPLHARSLEELSEEYLGYAFPAAQLHYWIRGIDAPGSRSRITLDADNRLAALEQAGWRLEYDRYQSAGALALPGRIRMNLAPYRLTFLISRWDIDG